MKLQPLDYPSVLLKNTAIVMDYSGTIVDDIRPTKDAFNYVLIRRGMDPVSITQFRNEFDLPYWEYLVSCGISEDVAKSDEVLREIEDAYMMHLYQVVPFREAVSAIACLSSMGAGLAIASSSTRRMLQAGLNRFHLNRFFRSVVAYEDCPKSKPDPTPLTLALGRLGQFRHCFYFGDMCADVVAAHSARMTSVSMSRRDSYNTEVRLEESGTDYLARDLWEAARFVTKRLSPMEPECQAASSILTD